MGQLIISLLLLDSGSYRSSESTGKVRSSQHGRNAKCATLFTSYAPHPATSSGEKSNTFSILFTAILLSFSTDLIMAFFGGTIASASSLLSFLFFLVVIALFDAFLDNGGCLFVDARDDDDDEKLSDAEGGEAEVLRLDDGKLLLSSWLLAGLLTLLLRFRA